MAASFVAGLGYACYGVTQTLQKRVEVQEIHGIIFIFCVK